MGAVGVDDDEEIYHGVESDPVEAPEEAAGATHIVADGPVLVLLQGVERGDSLEESVLASRVVFFEDTSPHLGPIEFIRGVV